MNKSLILSISALFISIFSLIFSLKIFYNQNEKNDLLTYFEYNEKGRDYVLQTTGRGFFFNKLNHEINGRDLNKKEIENLIEKYKKIEFDMRNDEIEYFDNKIIFKNKNITQNYCYYIKDNDLLNPMVGNNYSCEKNKLVINK